MPPGRPPATTNFPPAKPLVALVAPAAVSRVYVDRAFENALEQGDCPAVMSSEALPWAAFADKVVVYSDFGTTRAMWKVIEQCQRWDIPIVYRKIGKTPVAANGCS